MLLTVLRSLRLNASTVTEKVTANKGKFVMDLSILIARVGHATKDCTSNRVFDLSGIAEATAEDAWAALEKADEEKDLDDIRNVSQ